MKIVALDIGDVWTGTAMSDVLGLFAKPYKTVTTIELPQFLKQLLDQENIQEIVVGYPKTLRGTISEQTKKVETAFGELKHQFPSTSWRLWDERLTSKQADQLKKAKTKEEKIESHSVAAAFILASYLDYCYTQKNLS